MKLQRYKIYSCNEEDYILRFNAENYAHALMQWDKALLDAESGTYQLYQEYQPSPVKGCVCWELVKQTIKD